MEKVTAAVLITRREATAEASLARRRDLRKLGTAIAAMIRITVTTRSSSIRENPLWLRMRSPQASASARGRGPQEIRPTRILSGRKPLLQPHKFIKPAVEGGWRFGHIGSRRRRQEGSGRAIPPG